MPPADHAIPVRMRALGVREVSEGGGLADMTSQQAEAHRLQLISQRDHYASLAMHKKRLEVERRLKYQTCEVLRLWLKERAGS